MRTIDPFSDSAPLLLQEGWVQDDVIVRDAPDTEQKLDTPATHLSSTNSWTFEIDPESGVLSGNHSSQAVSCNRRRLEALVLSMSTRAKNTMGFPTTNPFPSLFMEKCIPAALSAPT